MLMDTTHTPYHVHSHTLYSLTHTLTRTHTQRESISHLKDDLNSTLIAEGESHHFKAHRSALDQLMYYVVTSI